MVEIKLLTDTFFLLIGFVAIFWVILKVYHLGRITGNREGYEESIKLLCNYDTCINRTLHGVIKEYLYATKKYTPMHTTHHGYAVIAEELDELWSEIKKKPDASNREAMEKEAWQVAACAIRFSIDLCGRDDIYGERTGKEQK